MELKDYNFPADLKNMTIDQMELLSYGIRDFLVESISKTGGHLASNLGSVELTIGLHKVFDSPKDKLIWDVGHQSYVHKILTGRASGFDGLRKEDGISGFPKRSESPHDIYDSGHSSTSISIASGIAAARDAQNMDFQVVSILGDGSLTGGIAYEALNNLGMSGTHVIVVLNDNGMSISKNIGSMADHLNGLRTSSGYQNAKGKVRDAVDGIPVIGHGLRKAIGGAKDMVKYAIAPEGVIFEELGLTYMGPIDGHNIETIIETLEKAKHAKGPVLVHAITKKGKGYFHAENEPDKFHGIGAFDVTSGKITDNKTGEDSYSSIFGDELCALANKTPNLVAISAAMCQATGLGAFQKKYPKRLFDVGIAEAHGVSFATGLALGGQRPWVAIYSSFLQRGYDQILEDVCLHNLPVKFAIDRAGVVGADGETHHGIFDISYLLPMPNMEVFAPADGGQMRILMRKINEQDGPAAIRYPRGNSKNPDNYLMGLECDSDNFGVSWNEAVNGENHIVYRGGPNCKIWILALGTTLEKGALATKQLIKQGIEVNLVNVCHIKNTFKLEDITGSQDEVRGLIVTLEDGVVEGGFGSFVAATVAGEGLGYQGSKPLPSKVVSMGWPNKFIEHGSIESLEKKYGFTAENIAERIVEEIERTS